MNGAHNLNFRNHAVCCGGRVRTGRPAPDAGPEAAYCESGEQFYPHGRIVRMGERWFRFCRGTHYAPDYKFDRYMLVLPTRNTVAHAGDFPNVQISFSVHERPFERGLSNQLGSPPIPGGDRWMGGVRYLARLSKDKAGDSPPVDALYIYDPRLNPEATDLPPHYVYCIGENTLELERTSFSCFLFLKVGDLVVKDQFIDMTRHGGPPIPFDAIPEYARGLPAILSRMDVTEGIDRLREFVPVIEPLEDR